MTETVKHPKELKVLLYDQAECPKDNFLMSHSVSGGEKLTCGRCGAQYLVTTFLPKSADYREAQEEK